MKTTKHIALVNVPSQLGAGCSASGHGWFSRVDKIRDYLEAAGLVVAELYTIQEPYEPAMGNCSCRYLDGVANVVRRVTDRVGNCLNRGLMPVIIGGDHSNAIGSVSAAAQHLREKQLPPPGLLWVDAHIDINTVETTPSGNIHGMALATILGLGGSNLQALHGQEAVVRPENATVVGFRFADPSELPNIPAAGPAIYSMRDIDQSSVAAVMDDVLPRIAAHTGGVHLSLDLDSLDPSVAPAVNTPFPGGMTFREVRAVCDRIAATGQLMSLDIMEHNPEKGEDELMLPLMAELIACALGASAMPDVSIRT